jgi:hypothetical protein
MSLQRFRAFALLVELRELAELAATLELLEPPEGATGGFAVEHAGRIRRVVEPALRVFEELEAVESQHSEGSRIADECFVARLGLAESLRMLDTVDETTDGWDVLTRANHTIGTLVSSAVNLEVGLCRSFEMVPRLSRLGDVERAVGLRNAYRRMLRAVSRAGEPADEEVQERLRQCRRALDALLEQAIPTGMRIGDRREAVLLRRRIDEWLAGQPGTEPRDGRRIWQDLVGFAELLLRINERQELIVHDLDVARRVLERLPEGPGEDERVLPLPEELARLYGRDPELDALIEQRASATVGGLRARLEELLAGLRPRDVSASLDQLLTGAQEPSGS